ncbi:MAG: copper-binding protein [Gammaproteobacteria bacterium]|nr:copper-binding protein [Gammaproteobacteria bacterium]
MKKLLLMLMLVCGVSISTQTIAGDEHKAHGVIKDIKESARKLTISHGPIASLGMDGMTMDFAVSDPAMMADVKKGHAVDFVIEANKKGDFIIVDIEDKGMAN